VRILITGANGVVGQPLYEHCLQTALDAVPAGRVKRDDTWLAWDMAIDPPDTDRRFDCLVHTAPLWLLPARLPDLAALGIERVVAYGSTSLLTKERSADESERRLAAALADAEARLWSESERLGMQTTVFRPTMIYGYGRDRNVNAIARFIRKRGFFPLAGRAAGRRQPLSAHDAVAAALSGLACPAAFGATYVLCGAETLSYRALVARVFQALGRSPRLLTLPTGLLRALLELAGTRDPALTGAMATRMHQDLVFDASAAGRDFGFAPERFLEHPERDLAAA